MNTEKKIITAEERATSAFILACMAQKLDADKLVQAMENFVLKYKEKRNQIMLANLRDAGPQEFGGRRTDRTRTED